MVAFYPEKHEYKSLDVLEGIDWVSVTTLVGAFKNIFRAVHQAEKSSENKKSKWYGLEPDEILQVWLAEATRSTTLGSWYHGERESELLACDTIELYGKHIPIISPIIQDGIKIAPEQKLTEGVYPEHMVYLKTVGICGQVDYVEVVDNFLNIDDYKTGKEIKTESYRNWEGISKKMLPPLAHVEDCNIVHFGLQLSFYMYIILKHNPQLKAGNRTIRHIIFEQEGRDKYDNPITKLDDMGNPIVKDVVPYLVPYYKREVEIVFDWLKNNRNKLKKEL